ncbi:MAG: T9SS type A sorting domain-containing protein [Bacteroidota bacterium]|jgi:predicted peptidase
MKKIYLLLLVACMQLQLNAQVRYLDEVFSSVSVDSNVSYGFNFNVYSIGQELNMDIYTPDGDSLAARPLVILAHGGSFIGGDRKLPDIVSIATALAKRGYVTASIQYRLGVNVLSGNPLIIEFTNAVWRAVQDGRAAVRYFRKDAATANAYKIDTSNIYFGGISAGGVLGLHLAYFDRPSELSGITVDTSLLGGFDGNSGNPGYSWRVKGVVNLCGAIGNVNWLYDNNKVAICNVHGDQDQTVPYGSNDFYYAGLKVAYLQGSYSVDSAARLNGMYSQLKTFAGQDHVPFSSNAQYMDTTIKYSAEFLYNMVQGNIRAGVQMAGTENRIPVYPNPANSMLNLELQRGETYLVTDLTGKRIAEGTALQTQTQLDVSEWNNGVYVLHTAGSRAVRIVVQH